jgi:hypothetical protein
MRAGGPSDAPQRRCSAYVNLSPSDGKRRSGFLEVTAMNFDFGKVLQDLGDDLIGDAGEQIGLERGTAVKVGHALASHWSQGKDEAIKAAAAESGVAEEVVSQLLQKAVDKAKEKGVESVKAAFTEGPVADAVEQAKEQAMAALGGKTGFLGKLFGKK